MSSTGFRAFSSEEGIKIQPRRSRTKRRMCDDLDSVSGGDVGLRQEVLCGMQYEAPPNDGVPVPQVSCKYQVVGAE